MSKSIKEEVKKQIVDEIDTEIVDELKKELRTEVKKDRKAKIKGEIEQEMEGVENNNNREQIGEMSKTEEQLEINISDVEKTIYRLEKCCLENTRRLFVLIGALSGFCVTGGAIYLYHILCVEAYVLGVYGLIILLLGIALLWIQCELRECQK